MFAHNLLFVLIRDPLALLSLLVVTAVPTAVFGWGLYVDSQIVAHGLRADADVTDHYVSSGEGGSLPGLENSLDDNTYYVEYEFSPPGNAEIYLPFWVHNSLWISVPKNVYDEAKRTKRISVEYLRSQPQWNRPPDCGTTGKIFGLFFGCLGVNLVVLVGVIFAVNARSLTRREATPRDTPQACAA